MINEAEVLEALKDLDCVDASSLKMDVDFGDQGMDSLDTIQIIFVIQEVFDVEISDEELGDKKWNSVQKIVMQLNILK